MQEQSIRSHRDAINVINRQWHPLITEDERSVLLWILERTYAFHKKIETIPVRHFLDGVLSGDGDRICWGLGFSRASLFRVLENLKRKRLLSVTGPVNYHRRYEVNLDAVPLEITLSQSQRETTRSQPETTWSQIETTPRVRVKARVVSLSVNHRTGDFKVKIINSPRSAPGQSVIGVARQIADRSVEKKTVKLAAGGFDAMYRHYHDMMAQYWPQAARPGFRIVDKAKFKSAVLTATVDHRRFIEYIVSEWGNILNREFPKDRRTPAYPDIGYISVYRARFIDAFNKSQVGDARQVQGRDTLHQKVEDEAKDREIAKLRAELGAKTKLLAQTEEEAATYHARLMRRDSRAR